MVCVQERGAVISAHKLLVWWLPFDEESCAPGVGYNWHRSALVTLSCKNNWSQSLESSARTILHVYKRRGLCGDTGRGVGLRAWRSSRLRQEIVLAQRAIHNISAVEATHDQPIGGRSRKVIIHPLCTWQLSIRSTNVHATIPRRSCALPWFRFNFNFSISNG